MEPRQVKIRFLLSRLFLLGCVLGFAFQAYQVCDMYFTYRTTSSIEFREDAQLLVPSFSVCVRYLELLNRSQENMKKFGLAKTVRESRIPTEQSKLTIRQIFNLTPPPEDIFISCCLRGQDDTGLACFESTNECLEQVKVTKFYTQEHICYDCHFTKRMFSASLTARSLHSAFEVYFLSFKHLNEGTIFTVIAHMNEKLPFDSRNFGQKFFRLSEHKPSHHTITYGYHEVQLLPPPYETKCHQTIGWNECLNECVSEAMIKQINRFPSTEMTDKPLDVKHASAFDYGNSTIKSIIIKVQHDCEVNCQKKKKCLKRFCTTYVSRYGFEEMIYFLVQMPQTPSTFIMTFPKVTFLDFFIYIFSAFGLWFGFSVLSLDPTRVTEWKFFKKGEVTISKRVKEHQRQFQLLRETIRQMREDIKLGKIAYQRSHRSDQRSVRSASR